MNRTRATAPRITLLVLILIQSTGCATWSPVQVRSAPREIPNIVAGDIIRVTRVDGNTTDFRVVSIWPDSLNGSMRFRPDSTRTMVWDEIRSIERFDANTDQSAGFVLGIMLFGGAILRALSHGDS
ncbi:MAG TPA: hypothetical protein VFN22_09705 [Gemmatimonadales bacterium]|nr:hypothetical protein [Gemmatimonadales bacterium]